MLAEGRLIAGMEESAARDFADRTAEILNWSPASSLRYNDRMLGLTQVATPAPCHACVCRSALIGVARGARCRTGRGHARLGHADTGRRGFSHACLNACST